MAPSNQNNKAKNSNHNKTPTNNAKRFRMCREPNFSIFFQIPETLSMIKQGSCEAIFFDLPPESSLELFGFTEVNIVNN